MQVCEFSHLQWHKLSDWIRQSGGKISQYTCNVHLLIVNEITDSDIDLMFVLLYGSSFFSCTK